MPFWQLAMLVRPSRVPHWISKIIFVLGSYAKRQSWKGFFLLGFNLVKNQCVQQRCFEKWTEYKFSQGKSCRSTGKSVFIYRDFCAVPCSTLYWISVYSTDYTMPLAKDSYSCPCISIWSGLSISTVIP